jgi:hypothetical protein
MCSNGSGAGDPGAGDAEPFSDPFVFLRDSSASTSLPNGEGLRFLDGPDCGFELEAVVDEGVPGIELPAEGPGEAVADFFFCPGFNACDVILAPPGAGLPSRDGAGLLSRVETGLPPREATGLLPRTEPLSGD